MRRFKPTAWMNPEELTAQELEALKEMPEKFKRIIYRAWSLRKQFSGEWDEYYFPALAQALDIAFRSFKYPDEGLPMSVKRVITRWRNRQKAKGVPEKFWKE